MRRSTRLQRKKENGGEEEGCVHVGQIQRSVIENIAQDPSEWYCSCCDSMLDIWLCLECLAVGCGKYSMDMASQHFEETQHCLAMDLSAGTVYCFACCAEVVNDSPSGDIQFLRELLECILSSSGRIELKDHESMYARRDKLSNLIRCWGKFAVSDVLTQWRALSQQGGRSKKRKGQMVEVSKRRRVSNGEEDSKGQSGLGFVPGKTGLRNLGNTCFMNAIIQILSNTVSLRTHLLQPIVHKSKHRMVLERRATIECFQKLEAPSADMDAPATLMDELTNILRVVWSGRWSVVTPLGFLHAVWDYAPQYRNYQQQDAQEFLVHLLDGIHRDAVLNSINKEQPTQQDIYQHPSFIRSVFEGTIVSRLECGKCGRASTTKEPFLDLALNFPIVHIAQRTRRRDSDEIPHCDIQDMLAKFTQPEQLVDGCFCDGCRRVTPSTKSLQLDSLPEVLCLVLKRFSWTSSRRGKVDTRVDFPLEDLDLGPYTTSQSPCHYRLSGTVNHYGSSIRVGHYTAFCYNPTSSSWLHFNDTRVQPATSEEVANGPVYMLFYNKL